MNFKEAIKLIEKSGTKISKDKLFEELRRSPMREFDFVKDAVSGLMIIKFKL